MRAVVSPFQGQMFCFTRGDVSLCEGRSYTFEGRREGGRFVLLGQTFQLVRIEVLLREGSRFTFRGQTFHFARRDVSVCEGSRFSSWEQTFCFARADVRRL